MTLDTRLIGAMTDVSRAIARRDWRDAYDRLIAVDVTPDAAVAFLATQRKDHNMCASEHCGQMAEPQRPPYSISFSKAEASNGLLGPSEGKIPSVFAALDETDQQLSTIEEKFELLYHRLGTVLGYELPSQPEQTRDGYDGQSIVANRIFGQGARLAQLGEAIDRTYLRLTI